MVVVNGKCMVVENHLTHEPYTLTAVYNCEYSEDNENFSQKQLSKGEFPELKNRVKIFSTRNDDLPEAVYKESVISLLESKKKIRYSFIESSS